jgi:hypothetical protein
MVQKQKWIEVIESPCCDASLESYTGPFDNGLRSNNVGDLSWYRFHGFFSLRDAIASSNLHIPGLAD